MAYPESVLKAEAKKLECDVFGEEFARKMDQQDPLAKLRARFCYPKIKDIPGAAQNLVNSEEECVYLSGNSLGLKPRSADTHMQKALDDWGKWGVLSHFAGSLPAASCDLPGLTATAKIVGAKPSEIALMNGLTVNLHLLMVPFYRPTATRHKILMEARAFPSDRYAIHSQIKFHGLDSNTSLIAMAPKTGEHTLRMEDILKCIEEEGDSISLIIFSGVQYYTGQKFDMKAITDAGHRKGCVVGFDLAHAVGNVEIQLHDWGIDFACWCSYKYLNSGAGGIGGAFIHEKIDVTHLPVFHGWWSNKHETRFEMKEEPDLADGVASLRLSNPPPWLTSLNVSSLEIFEETSMKELTAKQFLLTGYLELLLDHHFTGSSSRNPNITVITPRDPKQRGCQLSIMFNIPLQKVHRELEQRGVVSDIRMPNVMRIAPAPLYNSFYDVFRFIGLLQDALEAAT